MLRKNNTTGCCEKKYRSFKAKMLNSVLEVSDKNPSDGSCLPLE
jgi:hypothetical protein